MIEKAIIKLLLQSGALTALVGNRIYPNIIQVNTYPAIYVVANRMEKLSCDAPSGVLTGSVEIGVYAKKYEECYECIQQIRAKLDEYSGLIGNVGITFLRGEEVSDNYDADTEQHSKAIEYQAFAQIKSTN